MRLLGSQTFKSNNCIADVHENCALGFSCECGCHYPAIELPPPMTEKQKQVIMAIGGLA